MRYVEPEDAGRDELEQARAAGDVERVCAVLVGVALHEDDGAWVQRVCLELVRHDAAAVRTVAATCLGHVARIHGTIDRTTVVPALESLRSDPEAGGTAAEALRDIAMFVR